MTAQTEPLCTHFSVALPLPRIMGVWPVGDGEFERRLFSSFICTPSYFPPSRTMSTLLSYLLRWNLNGRVCFVLRKIQILRGSSYRLSDFIHTLESPSWISNSNIKLWSCCDWTVQGRLATLKTHLIADWAISKMRQHHQCNSVTPSTVPSCNTSQMGSLATAP